MAQDMLSSRFTLMLSKRSYPKTLCPSEIARSLSASELHELEVSEWRNLMPQLRSMAFEARDRGDIEILQRGQVVDRERVMDNVTGPIRIRRVRSEDE